MSDCLRRVLLVLGLLVCWPAVGASRPELLVAHFEGATYGAWKVTGTAFGKGKEVELLREKTHSRKDLTLKSGDNPLAGVKGELLDVAVEFRQTAAGRITLTVRGVPVVYDAKKGEVSCREKVAPLKPRDGTVRLRVLADRGSLEIFGTGGRVALSVGVLLAPDNRTLALSAEAGEAKVKGPDGRRGWQKHAEESRTNSVRLRAVSRRLPPAALVDERILRTTCYRRRRGRSSPSSSVSFRRPGRL